MPTFDDVKAIMSGWERVAPSDFGPGCCGAELTVHGGSRRCSEPSEYVRAALLACGDVGDESACAWHAEHGTCETRSEFGACEACEQHPAVIRHAIGGGGPMDLCWRCEIERQAQRDGE